jgi:ribonucleotide reductase alpha subunit
MYFSMYVNEKHHYQCPMAYFRVELSPKELELAMNALLSFTEVAEDHQDHAWQYVLGKLLSNAAEQHFLSTRNQKPAQIRMHLLELASFLRTIKMEASISKDHNKLDKYNALMVIRNRYLPIIKEHKKYIEAFYKLSQGQQYQVLKDIFAPSGSDN